MAPQTRPKGLRTWVRADGRLRPEHFPFLSWMFGEAEQHLAVFEGYYVRRLYKGII